jgi:hypothetical protein
MFAFTLTCFNLRFSLLEWGRNPPMATFRSFQKAKRLAFRQGAKG